MSRNASKQKDRPAIADGKRRLIDAALQLSARGAPLSSLGLRELAREADLNHNTFYRHFGDIEELAEAAATEIAGQLMEGMKKIRQQSAKHADATQGAAEYFLDFVREYPDACIVALRELHGGSPAMRRLFRDVIDNIATESVDQIVSMNLVPGLNRENLFRATSAITYNMLYRSLDYIEQPKQREVIIEQIVTFIRMQFFGAAALQNHGVRHD